MTQEIIYPYGTAEVSIPVGQTIVIAALEGKANIYLGASSPNFPISYEFDATIENEQVEYGTYSVTTPIRINAKAGKVYYNVGSSPTISLPSAGAATATTDPISTTGLAAAQGGEVEITGGTSSTSANAGGAVTITGGTPGATGVGGAITATGGAGGATSGTGGAVSATGGAGTGAGAGGGAASVTGGAGAAHTTGTGGAGGAASMVAAAGAAATGAAGIGGAGGSVAITAGAGGAASDVASGVGGDGGDITLTPGAGGASTGSTNGAAGLVKAAGLFTLNTAQVLDMADATVQLTVSPGTTAGTLLTSNIMRVDPNSSGAGEDLELPPEADVPGLVLWIFNTGGENIVVKDDSGVTTVDTIATTEFGFFFCDGTAWHGMNVA